MSHAEEVYRAFFEKKIGKKNIRNIDYSPNIDNASLENFENSKTIGSISLIGGRYIPNSVVQKMKKQYLETDIPYENVEL